MLREKLIALSSKEMIVIVDENKIVENLGAFPVAVEIIRFFYRHTLDALTAADYKGSLRMNQEGLPYTTDNGNYIFDIRFDRPIENPIEEHKKLKSITGVVETGFFFDIACRVVIGYKNGSIKLY